MQPGVRLRHGREPRREHAEQHTARAGAGWQAHLGEPERRQARRGRSSHRPRAQLVVSRPLGDAAATSSTCGTQPARTPCRSLERVEVLHGAHRPACSFAGLQPCLGRTDERRVPQDGSETKRHVFSDLTHLRLDPIPPPYRARRRRLLRRAPTLARAYPWRGALTGPIACWGRAR